MKRFIRLAAVLSAVAGVATAVVAYATAGPPNHANRLEATLQETVQQSLNYSADYGTRLGILTGSGTLEGFGAVTSVAGFAADVSIAACGAGSSTGVRSMRITAAEGTLSIRTDEVICVTPQGRVGTGTYEVDGLFSTGVFAGARGSGTFTNLLVPHIFTISGKLKLANDES